ncbi:MAG: hypothetical protein ACREB3_07350, partial [Burkholderiales bacterium]
MFAREQLFQILRLHIERAAEAGRELFLRRVSESLCELFLRAIEIFDREIEFAEREKERREPGVIFGRQQVAFGVEVFAFGHVNLCRRDARPRVPRLDVERGVGRLPRLFQFAARQVVK